MPKMVYLINIILLWLVMFGSFGKKVIKVILLLNGLIKGEE